MRGWSISVERAFINLLYANSELIMIEPFTNYNPIAKYLYSAKYFAFIAICDIHCSNTFNVL